MLVCPQTEASRVGVLIAELIDAIVCPPNHFRKSDQEIIDGCVISFRNMAESFVYLKAFHA